MENGKGGSRKGRRLASSRRRQIREPADGQDTPAAPEPETWPPHAEEELQSFFRDCGAKERGFVTREDLAEAKFSFVGSEEPQMIFDWVDTENRGRLSLEEFSSGLKNVFGSSPGTHRLPRKQTTLSQPVSATFSLPALEEADAEEKEAFRALVGQMGTGHSLSEQAEIWKLWRELGQEEPRLAGNLEGFLAKMSIRLQEARADREALEWTLRKRDSDHLHNVRQLYEETEEQIRREKQQLQAQSDSRGMALRTHMQEALEAKEQEVQRLAEGQRELEAQLLHLSSTQQEASWENLQLREAERNLAGQLEEVRGQLQVTRGHLDTARGRASWQVEEEPSVPRENKKAPDPPAVPTEEAPLPELFGDNDDWDQLLNTFGDHSHRTLQLCWSPPPTPSGTSGPQTPRIVRQISISKLPALQFAQEPTSDPDPGPRSPAGVPPGTKDRRGVEDPEGQDAQDGSSKQPVDTPGLEARPESPFLWSLLGARAGESESVGAEAFRVRLAFEAEPPPRGLPPPQSPAGSRKQSQAPDLSDESLWPGPDPAKLPMAREDLTEGLKLGLGSQGAMILPEGAAEPSSPNLEPVGQVPTETPVQGEAGLARQESHSRAFQEAHGQVLKLDSLATHLLQSPEEQPRPEEGNSGERGREDLGSEQADEAHSLEARGPESPQRDDLQEAHGQVLKLDSLAIHLRQSPKEQPRPEEGNSGERGREDLGSEQADEAHSLEARGPESPPRDGLQEPDTSQAPARTEVPAPGKMSPPRGSPIMGSGAGLAVGAPETARALLALTELEAQPRSMSMPVQVESKPGTPQPPEPGAESRPEDPGTNPGEAELTAGKPQADPDYLYHVIFLGDSNVGKTSFLHLLHHDAFATGLTATVGVDFRTKTLVVDNKNFALQLWDTAGQERYHSLTRQLLRKAEGVVLMYDVTSRESFTHVRYWLDCLQDAGADGVAVVLLGNKMDCEEERQVPTEAGRRLAQELGVSFGECSAALGHNILEPLMNLARSLKMQEDRLKASMVEVAHQQPPKRAGCCR
ncbi:ras-related protein Rab-44 isoform X1 [Peromyscus leucopus]|uniref:ras-related protein Rab-44 isoform X1 n=1 Tax=Peromyscus leucopus TaxID=10041 RepID=UPI001884D34C|nr:ras-related protein Rab-44 isoform X1 [Peromyscus leucopus]XP_037055726.1 ras-related protein Rab-44 isoform X1 [Peromyscus leucopus]